MNDGMVRERARARRFDAELAELLASPLPLPRAGEPARPQRGRWLAAAVILFGVLALAAVAWQVRVERREAQEPRPGQDPRGVPANIPAAQTTVDLRRWAADQLAGCVLSGCTDLAPLERCRALRWLMVTGRSYPDADLRAIAACRALEHLEVQTDAALAPLVALPRLRSLVLAARTLTADDAGALARMPALETLGLSGGRVDAGALAALRALPRLERLELGGVEGAGEDVLLEVAQLERLRALRLEEWGPGRGNTGLNERFALALHRLPRLQRLELCHVAVDEPALRALPARLTHVGYARTPLDPPELHDALAHLRLHGLDLRERADGELLASRSARPVVDGAPPFEDVVAAQVRLVTATAPKELHCTASLPAAMREAIARAPVETLVLGHAKPVDVAFAATLPHLRRLVLDSAYTVTVRDLEPLRSAPKLEQLHLRWTMSLPAADVRALLPGVEVTTHGY